MVVLYSLRTIERAFFLYRDKDKRVGNKRKTEKVNKFMLLLLFFRNQIESKKIIKSERKQVKTENYPDGREEKRVSEKHVMRMDGTMK